MEELKQEISAEVYQKLIDGNIDTILTIFLKSLYELQQLTNVPLRQLERVKKKAAEIILKNKFITADIVPPWGRLGTGCACIDSILSGGIPVNGITEIFGCSGVGKTQLCLQLALTVQLPQSLGGKGKEAVYICTEDVFPSRRFHQLATFFRSKYSVHHDFEGSVYLEHAADFEQLRRCLCVRLPQLLHIKSVGVIIIDSIAGVFRSENAEVCYTGRGQDIRVIATNLHELCDKFGVAVICVNQVTENIDSGLTEPCLGLAWGNYVTCRFGITRYDHNPLREFEVLFAPDLPNEKCSFCITEEGIVDAAR